MVHFLRSSSFSFPALWFVLFPVRFIGFIGWLFSSLFDHLYFILVFHRLYDPQLSRCPSPTILRIACSQMFHCGYSMSSWTSNYMLGCWILTWSLCHPECRILTRNGPLSSWMSDSNKAVYVDLNSNCISWSRFLTRNPHSHLWSTICHYRHATSHYSHLSVYANFFVLHRSILSLLFFVGVLLLLAYFRYGSDISLFLQTRCLLLLSNRFSDIFSIPLIEYFFGGGICNNSLFHCSLGGCSPNAWVLFFQWFV